MPSSPGTTSPVATSPVATSARSTPAGAGAAGRLRGLLAAHRAIAGDLNLPTMLERIVGAACDLVGARCGALGVLGADGDFEQLLFHGVDPATSARVASLPRNRDAIGVLLSWPPDGDADPSAARRPRPFLAAAIRAGNSVIGDLYLVEPAAGVFTAEDEELVTTLAALSGSAIHNAQLYADARRSAAWLRASGDIARALLRNADLDLATEVVSRAYEAGEADYGALIVPTEDGRLTVLDTVGVGAREHAGASFAVDDSPLGATIASGQPALFAEAKEWARSGFANPHGYGPALIAPLIDSAGLRGAVVLLRTADRLVFHQRDLALATMFAAQVAVAMEFDDARADAAWVAVLEDRQRIGRDLHDNVMQRLFATGIGLQVLAGRQHSSETSARVQRHIGELDEVIDEIRTRVFTLSESGEPHDAGSHAASADGTVTRAESGDIAHRRRSFPPSARLALHNQANVQTPRSAIDDRSTIAGHPHFPA